MMIRINNEFLEFDGPIEVEKQIKLMEELSTVDGDFSYDFEIDKTIQNTRILGNPTPDNISKPVYQRIEADLLNGSGVVVYSGYIRLDRISTRYHCSFFSGNNNWFGMISGLLSELDLSQYDIDQTSDNIQAAWLNDEGLTYPLMDSGPLITRSYRQLKVEDFIPALYVKTIFNKIFSEAGIKIQGELLNDWMFVNATCMRCPMSVEQIDARTTYAGKVTTQTVPIVGTDPPVSEKITWDTVTVYPFNDGSEGNFNVSTDRYTADVKMSVEVEVFIEHYVIDLELWIYKNGAPFKLIGEHDFEGPFWTSTQGKARITLDAGDYIEIYGVADLLDPFSGNFEVRSGYFKVTPKFIYRNWGSTAVPNWTKQKFVSNILRIWNCLTSYNKSNKTLTINLFEKLKDKTPIDLSEYISDVEVDYAEFISNYGKKSKLSYSEVDFEELRVFNPNKYFKYGQGYLEVNNDFLEEETDIVESDFSNPVAYENPVFRASLERLGLLELEDGDSVNFTGVTEGTGELARFAISEDIYDVGDLIRIEEDSTSNISYNGDWVVENVAAGWVELRGLFFNVDFAGSMKRMEYTYSDNDAAFLLINVPNAYVADISSWEWYYLQDDVITNLAYGYFDLLDQGEPINDNFLYSLSFGGNDHPRSYQITMTERNFKLMGRVLNDPAKLNAVATLPSVVYDSIDFLRPITIRTLETTNEYYANRISGYQESYLPCLIELIKLP